MWSKEVSQGSWQSEESYATEGEIAQVGHKVTVKVTVHDLTIEMQPNGAGDRHLRWNLWVRSFKICRQFDINEPNLGGIVEFEFKIPYKLQVVVQRKTLGISRIELLSSQAHMNRKHYKLLIASSVFETLSKETREFLHNIMSAPIESIDTEAEELVPKLRWRSKKLLPRLPKY